METSVSEFDDSRISEIIWRGAGVKSVRKIAEETGLRPEEVLRRKNELLEEVDPLTIQQTRQRLIIDLQRIARKTQEDYEASPFEFKAGLVNSAVASMKLVLAEMTRAEKADNSKVESLTQKRVAELVSLMREVVDISVVEIATKYGLDEEDLYEVFNRRMVEAAQKRDVQ